VYHLELRQFPHNLCRFNLTDKELRATVLEPWASERWIELGERKWSPHQAKLTVIEGPRLTLGELAMGRGWRNAQRQGRDVTAQLLAATRQALERGAGVVGEAPGGGQSRVVGAGPGTQADAPPVSGARELDLLADSLGLELLSQIGTEPAPLPRAWALAAARHPDSTASESLAVAERAVTALLQSKLIVLLRADTRESAPERDPQPVGDATIEDVLGAVESWTGAEAAAQIWMRRA
jgi:hypothetical protein